MTDGMQSLDFVESTGTGSMPAQRLRHRRTSMAEMVSPLRAGIDQDRPRAPLYLVRVGTETNAEPPEGVKETAAKLERLSSLQNDWDGSGAIAPSRATLLHAGWLLGVLHTSTLRTQLDWTSPHVSASEAGEVTFEWWGVARKLTLYIGENSAQYIKVAGPRIDEDMEDGDIKPGTFDALWVWLRNQ